MKLDRKLIVLVWVLFVMMFGASITLTILKKAGTFQGVSRYLSFVGPLSFLLGAAASLLTSVAIYRAAGPTNDKSSVPLEAVGAFFNGFAFWFLALFVLCLIGLIERPHVDMRALGLIPDFGALVVYLYSWLRSRRFSWAGLSLCLPFLFLVAKSLLRF